MAYNFRENDFAVAQFQEIDGWQVAEMTGIQEGIGGKGGVTNFTVLKLKMSEKHESLEESEESNIESSGTRYSGAQVVGFYQLFRPPPLKTFKCSSR